MNLSYYDLTQIAYIESVLNVRFNGNTPDEAAKFIQVYLLQARKLEPTYHELVNRRVFTC